MEKRELKRVGQLRPHKGHTLFKYTVATGRLVKVDQENIKKVSTGKSIVMAEEGCIYITALNLKNAIKKIVERYKSEPVTE